MRISVGCMRLFPGDIETLFPQLPRGTPVRLVDQLYKLAWEGERIWQELHPLPGQGDFLRIERRPHRAMLRRMQRELIRVARSRGVEFDPVALIDYPAGFSGMPESLPVGRFSVQGRRTTRPARRKACSGSLRAVDVRLCAAARGPCRVPKPSTSAKGSTTSLMTTTHSTLLQRTPNGRYRLLTPYHGTARSVRTEVTYGGIDDR